MKKKKPSFCTVNNSYILIEHKSLTYFFQFDLDVNQPTLLAQKEQHNFLGGRGVLEQCTRTVSVFAEFWTVYHGNQILEQCVIVIEFLNSVLLQQILGTV